ncbi:MAG: head-tail adaptor protein [Pseudomonadota bacterium]
MRAPELTRRLVLEEAVSLPDGAGGFEMTWSPLGELWAEVKAATGRERAADFATVSTTRYRIIVRAASDGAPSRPKVDQRFRDGARIFRILAVTEADAAARYLTCFAEEELAA